MPGGAVAALHRKNFKAPNGFKELLKSIKLVVCLCVRWKVNMLYVHYVHAIM